MKFSHANSYKADLTQATALHIVIVDGDVSSAIDLQSSLHQIGYPFVQRYASVKRALVECAHHQPDLVLLRVRLADDLSCIEMAHRLLMLKIAVIFLTDLDDEATFRAAQGENVLGYLVSPINQYTMASTLGMAQKILRREWLEFGQQPPPGNAGGIMVENRDGVHRIRFRDILYLRSNGGFCNLYTAKNKFVTNLCITKLEKELPGGDFFRCHRQYIVRLDKIITLQREERLLTLGTTSIPFSRRKAGRMQQLFLDG